MVHSGRRRRAPEERSSYREVLAVGEFRALWSAQVLSYTGDQFTQVAIAMSQIFGFVAGAAIVAILGAHTTLGMTPGRSACRLLLS